ncbi:MAG TPA: sugar phosphate isomerase/epimerase [Bacteroidales bacterium]|nr:sugar phosphate isomerase/epimerase [Bacteroidales bacterium]
MSELNRRNFFRLSGLGLAAMVGRSALAVPAFDQSVPVKSVSGSVGIASYSLRKFDVDQVITIMEKLHLQKISLKSMHLPLDADKETINTVLSKMHDHGLDPSSAGVIYMKSEDEVDNAFRYAQLAGFKIIVGVPDYSLLDYVEKRVKETDITLAIHNHGPDGMPYPSPFMAYDMVSERDNRMGLCLDVGHTVRAGFNPVDVIAKVGDRIFETHMRDVSSASKAGRSCRPGEGVIDLPAVMKALQKVGYTGSYTIEYEEESDDPLAALAQTAGYLQGILAGL